MNKILASLKPLVSILIVFIVLVSLFDGENIVKSLFEQLAALFSLSLFSSGAMAEEGIGGASSFAFIVVILAVVLIFSGVKTVPQGSQHNVERFGRFTR